MCNAAGLFIIVGAMAGAVVGYTAAVLLRRDRDDRLRTLIAQIADDTTDEATRRHLRDLLA